MTTQQRIERIAWQLAHKIATEHYGVTPSVSLIPRDIPRDVKFIIKALTAFAEEEANKWLPISSAPKDGTEVLITGESVYCGLSPYRWFAVAKYQRGEWVDGQNEPDEIIFSTPSHWQPLPEAPKQD